MVPAARARPLTVRVTFWGTRGSVPVPGPATVRYGGNTPCLTIEAAGEPPVVFDAGTGIRALGTRLTNGEAPVRTALFLTHTHWDHIQGLPFFAPLHQEGAALAIYGPDAPPGTLEQTIRALLAPAVFPVPFASVAAEVTFHVAPAEAATVHGLEVSALPVHHPGAAVGYRIHEPGSGTTVVYVPDNELRPAPEFDATARARLVERIRGASVLIHDSTYLAAESPRYSGWGHSTADEAMALARDAGVDELVLFHHAPDRDDDAVDRLLAECRAAATAAGGPAVRAAAEGATLDLRGR